MKILFLPNWHVHYLREDTDKIQSPDKYVEGKPYWFFRYFPNATEVDVIDFQRKNILHRFEKKIKFYIWQGILAFKRRQKYDVVISHGAPSALFYSLLCSLFSGKPEKPMHFIFDIGALNRGRSNRIEIALIRFAFRSKPFLIYHSSAQKVMYEKYYSTLFASIKFIPFGVDVEGFNMASGKTENYVFSFGFEMRDYKTLIASWKKVRPANFRLLIVGDAVDEDHDSSIQILPKVSFHDLKDYISRSSFVVIPLPFFNFSYGQMSFLQSMAMGKPVIVSKVPSSQDYLTDVDGVFAVKPNDKDAMCEKLDYIFANKNHWQEWGSLARKLVEEHFSEEKMAIAVYEYIKQNL